MTRSPFFGIGTAITLLTVGVVAALHARDALIRRSQVALDNLTEPADGSAAAPRM